MIKIDIISGFLGSGKTTLIKKLLGDAFTDEKLVIIENEFGDISIDGGFLKDTGINITEMNSGCICCSLSGDFRKALIDVADKFAPDRIIIEPSGVGKLSDVISAVKSLDNDKIKLNSFTTVVDANKCKIYHRNFGEFFNNQIENANTVVLSHTNNLEHKKLEKTLDIIKELNNNALIVTTPWDEITGIQLLDAMENSVKTIENIDNNHHHDEHCDCGCHDHEHHHEHHHDEHCDCGCHDHEHHHHHADEIFESIAIQSVDDYTENSINSILTKLSEDNSYGTILRAKGIVKSQNNTWIHFDYIPGEIDIRTGNADVTGKICVIGSKLNKDSITALFKQE